MRFAWVAVVIILGFSAAAFETKTVDNVDSDFSIYGYTIATTRNQQLLLQDISPEKTRTTSLPALFPSIWGTGVAFESPDSFIHLYSIGTNDDFDTKASGHRPSFAYDKIAFHTKESEVGLDLNNDGDTNDSVIRYFEASKVVNTQAAGENATIVDDFIVFQTPEEQINADLNKDNDVSDSIIRVYSLMSKQVMSQFIQGTTPTSSSRTKAAAFITEEAAAQADLNKDGDTEDAVIQYYSPAEGTAHSITFSGNAPSVSGETLAYTEQGKLTFYNTNTKKLVRTEIIGKSPQISKNAVVYNTGNSLSYFFAEDSDSDGFIFYEDNCADVSNNDQTDTDNDGYGNACDPDDDGDGIVDEADNCPLAANTDQTDTDRDGTGDACDSVIVESNSTNQTNETIMPVVEQVQEPEPAPQITAQVVQSVEPTPISGNYYNTETEKSYTTIYIIIGAAIIAIIIGLVLYLPGYLRRRRKSFGF